MDVGLKINGTPAYIFAFADDIVLIANDEYEANALME